jgi:hypothetical protein
LQQTQQRLADASSSSSSTGQSDAANSSAVDFLLQLAEALKPFAEEEMQWVLRQGQQQSNQQQHQQQQEEAATQKTSQQRQAGTQEEGDLQPQQQQEQKGLSIWDWDYQLHSVHTPLLQQLQDAALQQHMHLRSVLQGFSRLLQRLLGVQLLLRPAGQAETWGQHVRVVMLVKQQQQQQQRGIVGQGVAAGGPTGGCSVEVLGTVYLDVGGGYGTRVLRYTRGEEETEDLTSNGSSCSNVRGAEPLVAAMPALQWEQLPRDMQQELLQQSSSAVAVAVGISGTRLTLQKHGRQQQQQQQQQRMLQEQPSYDYDDVSDVAESSSSSSSNGALVLSVGQLWEFGHEMGHALHLVLSSR